MWEEAIVTDLKIPSVYLPWGTREVKNRAGSKEILAAMSPFKYATC
jgi:hypothetical protein